MLEIALLIYLTRRGRSRLDRETYPAGYGPPHAAPTAADFWIELRELS
jgi:hypothetical protein